MNFDRQEVLSLSEETCSEVEKILSPNRETIVKQLMGLKKKLVR
jgi:hypothetical protein